MQKIEQKSEITPETNRDLTGTSPPEIRVPEGGPDGAPPENGVTPTNPDPTKMNWTRPASDPSMTPGVRTSGSAAELGASESPDPTETKKALLATPDSETVEDPVADRSGRAPDPVPTPSS
jgi:hypothetical protein